VGSRSRSWENPGKTRVSHLGKRGLGIQRMERGARRCTNEWGPGETFRRKNMEHPAPKGWGPSPKEFGHPTLTSTQHWGTQSKRKNMGRGLGVGQGMRRAHKRNRRRKVGKGETGRGVQT